MTSERPTHILNVVSGEGKSARFTEVAALADERWQRLHRRHPVLHDHHRAHRDP